MQKSILYLLMTAILLLGLTLPKKPMREIAQEEKQELVQYLKSQGMTPEDYVVSKFQDYDIVFIGEHHHIKHDVELIHNLIPHLYKSGVYNLGIEFGCYGYQRKVDSLLTAPTYDEDLARWLVFKWGSYWPYKEYLDIYRKAWELNKSLPPDAPKFRVVNLDYRANWDLLREEMNTVQRKRVFYKGERDEYMSRIIVKEFVKKRKKALIYAGAHHAFTRYYQPIYDFEKKRLIKLEKKRMGNIIYRKMPDRVFNIFLHYPWATRESLKKHDYPVDGVIDRVMKEFKDKRIGFDVKDSPFGKLRDDDTYYSTGYEDFVLSAICDGYVFQKHFSDYEGCTLDPLFITKKNFREAIRYLPNIRVRRLYKNSQQFLHDMEQRANIKKKFRDLE
ncbi:MAG: hypothetical protein GTO17_10815 [Candidatus Aminicenantes bacterium]|nr:hypothetical protein [Candidatus Aminicenantes bacterium]